MDDNKILDLYFARSEQAIMETDQKYGSYCFRIASHILTNPSDAEESVNDTYMKAWDTIPPQRPEHFFAYIAKICRNFALKRIDWQKAKKRNAEVVSLTQEMETCIPDTSRDAEVEAR